MVEFVGIVLLGFPDFVPGAIRLSGWIRRRARQAADGFRRIVGRGLPAVVYETVPGGGVKLGGGDVTGRASTSATTIEEQVAYLLKRDQDVQRMTDDLGERLRLLEGESARQVASVKREMEQHVARELTAAEAAYRPLRVAGTVALALGLICATVGALLV
jgi:hypothetical protein